MGTVDGCGERLMALNFIGSSEITRGIRYNQV